MKNAVKSALLLTVIATASVSAQTIQDGLKQMDNDDVAAAKKIFAAYVQKNATDADGFFYFGNVLSLTGKADSAKAMYTKAIELNPKCALSLIASGRNALAANDAKTADNMLEKAVRVGKKSNEVGRLVAESYSAAKKMDKAQTAYADAIERDNKNPRLHLSMGDMYLNQKNPDGGKAVSSYELAAFYDKTLASAFLRVARIYRAIKNDKEQLAALDKAKAADANFPPVYRELSEYYYYRADYGKAKDLYAQYMKLTGSPAELRTRYLNILFYNKEYKEALRQAEEILKANPNKVDAYRAIGYATYELGDSVRSVDAMSKLIAGSKPEQILGADYEFYGKGLMKLKRTDEAYAALDKAVTIDTTNVGLCISIAEACTAGNDFKKAAKYYALAAKRKPKAGAQDYFNVGYSHFYSNDYAAAETEFKKVIGIRPEAMTGQYWALLAGEQQDATYDKGSAKDYAAQVIAIGSKDVPKYGAELKAAYRYLMMTTCKAKDVAGAGTNANELLKIDPTNENAKTIAANPGACQ